LHFVNRKFAFFLKNAISTKPPQALTPTFSTLVRATLIGFMPWRAGGSRGGVGLWVLCTIILKSVLYFVFDMLCCWQVKAAKA
jgi:hypothetical protein